MKPDLFTILIFAAVGLAIAAPGLGAQSGPAPLGAIASAGVALIFFLYGAKLSRAAIVEGFSNWRVQLPILGVTFVLFPLIGGAVYFMLRGLLSPDLALGFFFLCAVSSTVSTSVAMTALARGNVAAAVLSAAASGLLGVALTPLLMTLVVTAAGVTMPFGPALKAIVFQLLIPFAAGHALAFVVRPLIQRTKPYSDWVDRVVILLIVYVAFCDMVEGGAWKAMPPASLALMAGLVALLLAVIIAITTLIGRLGGFSHADRATLVFCGSQKSLAAGAPIAKILFGASPALGAIMLPLILYHQLQLIVSAPLARRYAAQADAGVSGA